MRIVDWVIIAIIAAVVIGGFAVRKIRAKKGNGCCSSCDKCSGCK